MGGMKGEEVRERVRERVVNSIKNGDHIPSEQEMEHFLFFPPTLTPFNHLIPTLKHSLNSDIKKSIKPIYFCAALLYICNNTTPHSKKKLLHIISNRSIEGATTTTTKGK